MSNSQKRYGAMPSEWELVKASRLTHAQPRYHGAGKLGRLLNVIRRAGGHLAEDELLRRAPGG